MTAVTEQRTGIELYVVAFHCASTAVLLADGPTVAR